LSAVVVFTTYINQEDMVQSERSIYHRYQPNLWKQWT